MCKVLFVAGIKRQHQDKVRKLSHAFVNAAGRVDNDGFGYAAITRAGQIYGEKWLRKEDAFLIHSQPKPPTPGPVSELLGEAARPNFTVVTEPVYDQFGVTRTKDVIQDTTAVIVHARKVTVGMKSIVNCHPFYSPETETDPATALMHNGSIINHYLLTKKTSTCDSETILHEYLKEAMSHNPWAMPNLAKTLVGQYTVGVLSSTYVDGDKVQPVLDIFKSAKELHCAYVKEIETFVFCTTPEILQESCKLAGLTPSDITEVRDGYLIRINALTGKRMEDLIPFDQSRQFLNPGNTSQGTNYWRHGEHHRPNPDNNYSRIGPGTRPIDDTVDIAKKNFEHNHKDLFTGNYYDVDTGLSKEEQEYYETLEADKQVDLKALRLVKKIMNF